LQDVEVLLVDLGLDPEPSTPAAFHALIKSDFARWEQVVQSAGLRQK
jgi:tripartite-type tricarboxylate transporter receptor subunit TctC